MICRCRPMVNGSSSLPRRWAMPGFTDSMSALTHCVKIVFFEVTRRGIWPQVLAGLDKARAVGFVHTKFNCVACAASTTTSWVALCATAGIATSFRGLSSRCRCPTAHCPYFIREHFYPPLSCDRF